MTKFFSPICLLKVEHTVRKSTHMTDITLSNKEVKKMTQNNEKSVVNITVNVVGVQEANQLVERLCEKIKEARTLAGDLTSLVESLEVNIHR